LAYSIYLSYFFGNPLLFLKLKDLAKKRTIIIDVFQHEKILKPIFLILIKFKVNFIEGIYGLMTDSQLIVNCWKHGWCCHFS